MRTRTVHRLPWQDWAEHRYDPFAPEHLSEPYARMDMLPRPNPKRPIGPPRIPREDPVSPWAVVVVGCLLGLLCFGMLYAFAWLIAGLMR